MSLGAEPRVRERVVARCSLEGLYRRRTLTPRQAAAGRRLAGTYRLGVVGLRHPGDGPCSVPSGWLDARIAAVEDYGRAREAVGPRLWPVVWAVACGDQPVRAVAEDRDINPTAAVTLLQVALDLLADLYGIPEGDLTNF